MAGYIVPKGAKTYDEWQKDDPATPITKEARAILFRASRPNFTTVADYFNGIDFRVGPSVRTKTEWDGDLVKIFLTNPILKGWPCRGMKSTRKHHESGRRISRKSEKPPVYYHAPHLAHLTEEEFDSMMACITMANANCGRPCHDGVDPLFGIPKGSSRFPGLHAVCWYCGYHYVWGGNGITENLMCNNSRAWHCWHGITFSGPDMVAQITTELCRQMSSLSGFDQQFVALVGQSREQMYDRKADERAQLRQDEENFAREKENLVATIKQLGPRPMLTDALDAIEKSERGLLVRRHQLEAQSVREPSLPASTSVIGELFEEEFQALATDSIEFADLLRCLVPEIYVYAVRLCDGGHLLPRAKVKLNLGGKFPDLNLVPGVGELLTRDFTIDLFQPKQRERIREESVRLAATGLGVKAIAAKIKERPTYQAVSNALALQKKMDALGIGNPYVTVLEPPDDYPKVRRHKNERYKFQPREGYERPEL